MKLISFRETYCDRCKKNFTQKNSPTNRTKEADKLIKTSRWQSVRSQVLLRDKCCLLCFKRGYVEIRGLQVHHIIKRVDDVTQESVYDPNNLVTVCKKCHEELEKLPISKQRDLLGNYEREIYDFRL